MDDAGVAPELERAFGRAARRLRGRLWLKQVLRGAAFGLAAGAAASGLAWWLRQGQLRPLAAALGVVGAAAGMWLGRRQRFSDEHVALYLDQRLGTQQQIVTALGIAEQPSRAGAKLQKDAAKALTHGAWKAPRVWDAQQLLGPLGLALIAVWSLIPLPKLPPNVAPPGSERLRPGRVQGLERIEALGQLRGRNPEDERRLRALAEEAKKLRGELSHGMEKREALSHLAKLRDSIAELRSEFGKQENRRGLEAAIGALGERAELRRAARALGDGDLTAFDREMQRLANQAERQARQTAREALEQAEREARKAGAEGLADALRKEREAFDEQSAEADALRELARALGDKLDPEALEDLKEFGQSGDPKAAQRLAEAMGKALSKLSAEERRRLAEQLQKRLEKGDGSAPQPLTEQELRELARRLASPDGERELEEQLRRMARPEPSEEARRQGALDDAERGLGDAERGLGAVPLPMPGPDSGAPGATAGQAQNGNDASQGSGAQGSGGPGSHHDSGRGDHAGQSKIIEAPELRAKANTTRSGEGPMRAATLGRAPARADETANQRGTGSLGSVAKGEIGAIEQSEVPEEYREHVGRYFEP